MSDHCLQYLPRDPDFQPTREAAAHAEALLAAWLPDAQSVGSIFLDRVRFFDPGGNWSGVECPACGADAEPWWGEAARSGFVSLQCVARCCGSTVSLDRLRYVWPAGFGRYAIEVGNPNSPGLSPDRLAVLESALGCELIEIPRRI